MFSLSKVSKSLALSVALIGSLSALEINPSGAKIDVVGYKNKVRTAVPLTFTKVDFKFNKTKGSAKDVLMGATATVDLSSIDTKIVLRNNNIKNKFFAHLAKQETTGKITKVKGNDKSGTLTMEIMFNGVMKKVDMKYEVKGDKLTAMGKVDFDKDFKAKKAYTTFAEDKLIKGLHGGVSYSDIDVGFEVPVK